MGSVPQQANPCKIIHDRRIYGCYDETAIKDSSEETEWFLTVDPGKNIGWALWNDNRVEPVAWGCATSAQPDWQDAADIVMDKLYRICKQLDILFGLTENLCRIYLEYPEFYGTHGGTTSARSGALIKLTISAGRIYQLCHSLGYNVMLLPPSEWKGQMRKEVTVHRITKRLPKSYTEQFKSSHVWDAIGMGLHVKGVF